MHEVAIVVTYSTKFPWRLARSLGFATWVHAALRYLGEDTPSPRIIEAAAGGVRERPWDELIAECDEYKLLRLKQELPEVKKKEVIAYAWGNVGKPYNYLWLLQVAWRLIKKQWLVSVLTYPAHICSSLVYDAYLYAGVDLVPDKEDILVTPDDLASSPLLEEVEVNLTCTRAGTGTAKLRRIPPQSRAGGPACAGRKARLK